MKTKRTKLNPKLETVIQRTSIYNPVISERPFVQCARRNSKSAHHNRSMLVYNGAQPAGYIRHF